MHDLKYANEILSAIERKAAAEARDIVSSKVTVNVSLSPFSHVTARGLKETFGQLLSEATRKNIGLNIIPLEYELHCRSCKNISKGAKPIFECPRCKSADFDIEKEPEFTIDSVEIE